MNFALSPALLAQLTQGGQGNGVYAWAFAFAGADLDQAAPNLGKLTLVEDGVAKSTSLALTDASHPTFTSGNVVVVIQENGAGNKSTFDTTVNHLGDVLSVTAAQTSNFRYDAIEVTLSGTGSDVADLTNITQFGAPIELQVGTDTRGYDVSGQTLSNDLAGLETITVKNQLAALQGWRSPAAPMADPRETMLTASNIANNPLNNPDDWLAYVTAFEATASNVRLATYFNGVAAQGSDPAIPAALLDYQVSFDPSDGGAFWLVPVDGISDTTNAPYSIRIPVAELTQNIYAQIGTLAIYTARGGTPVTPPGGGGFTPNNAYGDIAKYFVAGFDAGFIGASARASLNPRVTDTVNLNQSWNWGANYAYGAINTPTIGYSNPVSSGFFDKFAAEFYKNTNAYGYSYSDLISAGGGTNPGISVVNPGTTVDVSDINVTLFASSDAPAGYVPPGTSYIPPAGTDYLPADRKTTNGDQFLFDFGLAGLYGPVRSTPVLLKFYDPGDTSAGADGFVSLNLTAAGGASGYQNYFNIEGGPGNWSAVATNPNAPGNFAIANGLPVTADGSVGWYQVVLGAGTAEQKTYNIYAKTDPATQYFTTGSGDFVVDGGASASVARNAPAPDSSEASQLKFAFAPGGAITFDPAFFFTATPGAIGGGSGDVHMTAFDGLHYDFQAIGDFVVVQSTSLAAPWEIQMTATSWQNATSVTEALATRLGDHRITFAVGRDSVIRIDGTPETGLSTGTVQDLGGGTLTQLDDTGYRLDWTAGRSLTVHDVAGQYLDWTAGLGPDDGPGSVHGLLGSDAGQANDFQLPDGTVLAWPSETEIATTYADAWRVAPGASLLEDAPASAPAQLVQAMAANLVPTGTAPDRPGTLHQDSDVQNTIASSLLHP
jgi:hypothetical protein